MLLVLVATTILVFYLTRGFLGPISALAPYISPAMQDPAKLQLAQSLNVASTSCPSWAALLAGQRICQVPLWQQYFSWFQHAILQGQWGYSLLPGISGTETTWQVFTSRFPYTVELAVSASVLTILISIPLGILSATRNNKIPDHVSRVVAVVGHAMPSFWLGFILQIFFVLYLTIRVGQFSTGLLPAGGSLATNCAICFPTPGHIGLFTGIPIVDSLISLNFQYFWDSLVALILPSITLALVTIGSLTRVLRSSMLDVLRQDFILLARSKGIKERSVIYRHAFRNAMLPVLTITGLLFAYILGGVIIIEDVFDWPGVGQAALSASLANDVNFLELYTLVTAVIILSSNLLVDIVYGALDPRIRS